MRTTRTSLISALLTLGVCVSTAWAGAPMGPAIATLGEGQWSLGGEIAREQLDLEAFGTTLEQIDGDFDFSYAQEITLEDVEVTMAFGTLGYGICDNWDIFVRLGVADAQDDIILHPTTSDDSEDQSSLDSDFGFAWGAGTRATFGRSGPWSFGGLIQVTWFDPGESDVQFGDPATLAGAVIGDAAIDYWQTQVALTVAYQTEGAIFWAGPFLQFIEGDFEVDGQLVIDDVAMGTITNCSDLEESSQFGAHGGLGVAMGEQLNLWVEGQITSDSWLVGAGFVFIPEAYGL